MLLRRLGQAFAVKGGKGSACRLAQHAPYSTNANAPMGHHRQRCRRVVITGMGVVSPLGCTVDSFWNRLLASECGVRQFPPPKDRDEDESQGNLWAQIPSRVAASVPQEEFQLAMENLKEENGITLSSRRMARFIQFAMLASHQALTDAKWFPETDDDREQTGVSIGSGIGSTSELTNNHELLMRGEYKKISPFMIPKLLINMASGYVSIQYGLRGPNYAAVTACASASSAIGDAYRTILYGDANVMVAGGAESSLEPVCFAGFSRAKALCTRYNDEPEKSSRPFDSDRSGFVMGEGAGVLVLEDYEHAMSRGANIYAEVSGYGCVGEAYHITSPSPDGMGATRCMERALRQSGLSVDDIQYVNAHATSTPAGDKIEYSAIKHLFHSNKSVRVSSIKGAVGHLLGAAGSVEGIATALAVKNNIIPPTLNLENPLDADNTMLVGPHAEKHEIRHALSNSFGFGGTNTSLLFSKFSA